MTRNVLASAAVRFTVFLAIIGLTAAPVRGQVETALERAEAWLVGAQNPDGSFGTLAELAPRDSALAVLALAGDTASEPAVTVGAIYLQGVPEANTYFRSQRALALAATGRVFQPLLASLFDFRNGGGMGAFGEHQSTLLDTGLAVEALALEETTYLFDVTELLDYLQLHQRPDGGWGYVAEAPSEVYYTAEILRALARLERLAVGAGVRGGAASFLLGHQQADGSFGGVAETAVAYRALLLAGVSPADLPFGSPVSYLLGRQQADGSWEDDAFTTAEVILALRLQRPNLIIAAIDAPASSAAGSPITVTVTVRNAGAEAAGPSQLEIRYQAGGEVAAAAPVAALAPGEEAEIALAVDTTGFTETLGLLVVADAADEVVENDEDDNTGLVEVTLRAGVDLTLFPEDLSLDPSSPEPDTGFTLLVNARNLGETAAASFAWRVTRLVGGAPAEVLAAGSDGPIAAGGGRLIPVALALAEGEHTVEVTLDPDGTVEEENEANNSTTLTFFVVDRDQPDLAIADADFVLTPAAPAPGETVDVSITVRNLGNRDATADLALFENNPADGGVELRRFTLNLAAGGAETVSDTVPLSLGAYALTAVVDPDQAVLETDEMNNRVVRVFRDLPDLAIGFDNFEILTPSPLDGDPVEIALTVRNAGTAAATDVAVEVTAGGGPVFSDVIAEIPAAGNAGVSFTWTASAGLNTLVATADAGDAIVEISESNNQAEREVAVPRATGPDLEITSIDRAGLTESAAALTVDGTVDVEIANTGDEDVTAPFELRLFEDRDGDGRFDAGEPVLGSAVVNSPVATGAAVVVTIAVDATVAFHHPLAWAEVDAGDVIAEQREDNNRATLFADCEVAPPPSSGVGEPLEEWFLPGVEVETTPIVVQLSDDNGDGRVDSRDTPDVVFHTTDAEGSAILAVSGLDGSELWKFRSTPANPVLNHLGQVAAADLDGDGVAEVVGHQFNGRLIALEHTGEVKWVSDPVPGVGNRGLGGLSIGDLDGDGVPEIVYGRSVVSNDGRFLTQGTANAGQNWNYYGPFGVVLPPGFNSYPESLIADVDLDGINELVAGNAVYRLTTLPDGSSTLEVVWDATVPDKLMVDGFSAVGNLDGDPQPEIVYVSSGQIIAYNHDGSVFSPRREMVGFFIFQLPTFWGGPPTIADLNGDGSPEILVGTATHLMAFRAGLSTLWRRSIAQDFGGVHGVTAFDLDGDGIREVFFLADTVDRDAQTLYILDGATGATLYTRKNVSKTAMEYTVIADVDGDGRAELVVPSNVGFNGDASTQGLHVLGNPSWQGARPIWNQYGYHVTNVLLDGTVPSPQVPPWQADNVFRGNRELPAPPRLVANLTASFPRVGAATPEGVPVTVRVGNGGRAAVGAGVAVELFNADPATAEPVGAAVTTHGLRPGQWEDVVVLWTAAGAGGVPASAVVDRDAAVAECDETDNRVDFVLTETVLPDLSLAAGGVAAPSPSASGQVVAVTVTVDNVGNAAAAAFTVRLYDGEPGLGPVIGETAAGPLAPGAHLTVNVPYDTLGVAGLRLVHAVVDPDGVVPELAEDNNRGLTALELVPPGLADPAAIGLTVDPGEVTAGFDVVLRAEVLNRGAELAGGFEVGFFVNGAEAGRETSPASLAAGETRTVEHSLGTLNLNGTLAVEARIDPANAVVEENEGNNSATAGLVVAGSALRVTVATDRLSYGANDDVAINVQAQNNGAARDVALVVRVVDSAGNEVARVADEVRTLAAGATALPFTFNTGTTLPGAYTVFAEIGPAGGGVEARGSAGFSVARELAGAARLFADRDVYTPQQVAIFSGRVENTSPNHPLVDATATITVTDAGGGEVFASALAITTLVPGGSLPVNVTWSINGAAPGVYDVTLSLRDEFDILIAFAAVRVAVEDSAETGAGLRGEVEPRPDFLGVGAPLAVGFTVTNDGNADIFDLALRVELLRLADETVVAAASRPEPLSRGATVNGTFAFATAGLVPGEYLVSLTSVVPARTVRLDSAVLRVVEGLAVADAMAAEGDSGSTELRFTVSLQPAAAQVVTVDYATADVSATAGADYQAAAGTLTFQPGETAQQVAVTVFGDLDEELDELFLMNLTAPSEAALADAQALGTITDDEGCNSPNLLANPGAEDELAETEVSWTAASGGFERRFAEPPAFAGGFYFAGTAEPVSELYQDVDLVGFGGVIDNDGLELAFEGFFQTAGEDPSDEARVVVEYRDAGGAVLDAFDSGVLTSPGTWSPVLDRRVVPVGTRSARLRLIAARVTGTAADVFFDRLGLRAVGALTLSTAELEIAEGNGVSTDAVFTVTLACPAVVPITVDYLTLDVTATGGVDYSGVTGTLELAPGETSKDVVIQIFPDTLDEPDETFDLLLQTTADVVFLSPRTRATILDDDGPVALAIDDAVVTEGTGGTSEATFTVTLSAPSGQSVQVDYATAGDSATAPADYTPATGTLTFAPGVTSATVTVLVDSAPAGDRAPAPASNPPAPGTLTCAPGVTSATVTVLVVADDVDELTESFRVVLAAPRHATLGDAEGTATIVDDDETRVSLVPGSANEGDPGDANTVVLTVALSVPSDRDVTMDYASADLTAVAGEDYQAVAGTLTVPAGDVAGTIAVPVIGDVAEEATEHFLVGLSNLQNALFAQPEAQGTIVDDDGPVILVSDVAVIETDAGTVDAVLSVSLDVASTRVVSVDYATADDSAVAGDDYLPVAGTLTYQPGETSATVTVQVVGEELEESDEVFLLALANPVNAFAPDLEGAGTILDDDTFLLDVADAGAAESAGVMRFTVTLTPPSDEEVTVEFATTQNGDLALATEGVDYQPVTGVLTFPVGTDSQTIEVPVLDDALDEGAETFFVELASPVNALLGRSLARAIIADDERPASNPLIGTARDFRSSHPDFQDGGGSDPGIVETFLGADGLPVYTGLSGNSSTHGQEFWDQWYRDVPGVNLSTSVTITQGGGPASYSYRNTGFFPIDNRLFGNETFGRNFHFTYHLHTVFVYEGGEFLTYGGDDDAWAFINGRLAIDVGGLHGLSTRTVQLDSLAPTFGLEIGEVYTADFFFAERHTGGSAIQLDTSLYLQQINPGVLQFELPAYQVLERDGSLAVKVERVGGRSGTVAADFAARGSEAGAGSATAGADFAAAAATVTFADGATAAQTVTVPILDDGLAEEDETFEIALADPTGGAALGNFSTAVVTILEDDPPPTLAFAIPRVVEGDVGTFNARLTFTLSHAPRVPASFDYATADGDAVAGVDYQPVSGSIAFLPGETSKTITVPVIGDFAQEGDETFFVRLSNVSELEVPASTLVVTLQDDDRCPSPNLIANPGADEPLVGGNLPGWTEVIGTAWTQRTSSPSPQSGVAYFFPGSGANHELLQDVDVAGFAEPIDLGRQQFTFSGFHRSFNQSPPDLSRFILEYRDTAGTVLDVYDSGELEDRFAWSEVRDQRFAPAGTRTIRVRLVSRRRAGSANDGYYDTLSLRALGVPSFQVNDLMVIEGESGTRAAPFTVSLTCEAERVLAVDFLTSDGTAQAGADYESAAGTLVFQPGETAKTVAVTVIGDTVPEPEETFFLDLVSPVGAGIGDRRGVATIVQDEVLITIDSVTVLEGSSGTTEAVFTVSLTGVSTLPISVDYVSGGGSATSSDGAATEGIDYASVAGTLLFAPGETAKPIAVTVFGDTEIETDETFHIELSNPINAALMESRGVATIVQDDIGLDIADANVNEGDTGTVNLDFTLTLTQAASQAVTVDYATRDGSATAGVDYVAKSGTVTLPAGLVSVTLSIQVRGDEELESGETVYVDLTSPVGVSLLRPEATGFIADDDDCPSPNLLVNPGADEALVNGEIPGWTEVVGGAWTQRTSNPSPFAGPAYFQSGSVAAGELRQDVDVATYATFIDQGIQRFVLEGYLRSFDQSPADLARLVVEYRDAANAEVLDAFDTGETAFTGGWTRVNDMRTAPVGTRFVRLRLITRRQNGSGNDGYFDALSLRSLGTPTFQLADRQVFEGDDASVFAPIAVELTCASDRVMSFDYTPVSGTATAGVDFDAAGGTVTFQPGETSQTFAIEIFGDFLNEIRETFTVELGNEQNVAVLDRDVELTIRDADPGAPPVPGVTNVYTLDEDFDLGTLVSVHHDTPLNDQLQLSPEGSTFPFIWVAASGKGTIVKIDTKSGVILGEYSTNPDNRGNSDPSRTTVALDGSAWVGNRNDIVSNTGSVTHIGLPELNQCVDRNGNGVIDTSAGYNDILPWPNPGGVDTNGGVTTAEDECILHYVRVAATRTRHLSMNADNDLWVSGRFGGNDRVFDLIDGETGVRLQRVGPLPCGGYGGLVDRNNVLWSASRNSSLLRWDIDTGETTCITAAGMSAYGVGIAPDGWIWVAHSGASRAWKVSPDGTVVLGPFGTAAPAQGLAVDVRGHAWISTQWTSNRPYLSHMKDDGTFLGRVNGVPAGSSGVAIDADGKIWSANYLTSTASRIDPTRGPLGADGVTPLGEVDLVVQLPGASPYNYSDMTGFVALQATAPQGTWSVIQDSGIGGSEWGRIVWNTEPEAFVPEGGTITIQVRAADTVPGLGPVPYVEIQNGVPFEVFGRYLQIRMTMRPDDAGTSPVLSDLRIDVVDDAQIAIDDVTVVEGDGPGVQAVFTVSLAEPTVLETRVDFATVDGSAVAGADYLAAAGTLTFPAGETTRTIAVDIVGDLVAEPDEAFTVVLSSPVNGVIVDPEGVGTILDDDTTPAVPELAASKVDALAADSDGDGVTSPGDVVRYTITVANSGAGDATGVVLRDLVPEHTALVAGSVTASAGTVVTEEPVEVDLGVVAAGTTVNVSFDVTLDSPFPAGVDDISNQGTVTSVELPAVLTDDPDVGGDADPTVTMVTASPRLLAEKVDGLAADNDADGVASPGDEIAYTVTLKNLGNTAATGVQLVDLVPEHTTLVAGSVTSSAGTVESEDPPSEESVEVSIGQLAVGDEVTVTFRVTVVNPFPVGVAEVVNQGAAAADGLADVLTDDPDAGGDADPTVTPITAAPVLTVEKTDVLFADAGGDSMASPGDEILYSITVANSGNTGATAVRLTDPIPALTTVVAGTVQASQGTVVNEDPAEVDLGQIDAGAAVTVTFRVLLDQPFPVTETEVANQATVESAELEAEPSDDPDTAAEADPTVTPVFITPEVAVDDVTVTESDGEASFTVTLSEPSNRPLTVSFATVAGTALAGLDFETTTGSVVVAAGEVSATIPVPVIDDLLDEPDETFVLELTAIEGGRPADDEGLGTIVDDDEPPRIFINDVMVPEGDEGTTEGVFTLALERPSGFDVEIDFLTADGTALAGSDYAAAGGHARIAAGSQVAAVAVFVIGDLIDELNETFTVTLSNPQHVLIGDGVGEATILDDDEALISIDDVTVEEGDPAGTGTGTTDAVFTVTLATVADREIRVDYATAPETATAGVDYLPASGTLVFPAFTTEQTLAVAVVGDLILEQDETYRVELANAVETRIADPVGLGTILDDEACPGPNLLVNPGAERREIDGAISGWTLVEGDWRRHFGPPEPLEGRVQFFAGAAAFSELYQDVDVSAYASRIAAGDQEFVFNGFVRTFDEVPPDVVRILVEYRDAGNAVVLDRFDSGEITSPLDWTEVTDVRAAPAGTRWIRVSLLATRFAGTEIDSFVDALALRSLRAPTVTIDDVTAYEGDAGTTDAVFTVSLACPYESDVTVSFASADGGSGLPAAVAVEDYLTVGGTLFFPSGTTTQTIPVPVVGDEIDEPTETFLAELSNLTSTGSPVLLKPVGVGTILDDDFCQRSHGFWKTHTDEWPIAWVLMGGVEYEADEMLGFLKSKSSDATYILALQLVATKLNLARGSDPSIVPTVEAADAFLALYPPGSDPRGAARDEALALKDELDAYNNSCHND